MHNNQNHWKPALLDAMAKLLDCEIPEGAESNPQLALWQSVYDAQLLLWLCCKRANLYTQGQFIKSVHKADLLLQTSFETLQQCPANTMDDAEESANSDHDATVVDGTKAQKIDEIHKHEDLAVNQQDGDNDSARSDRDVQISGSGGSSEVQDAADVNVDDQPKIDEMQISSDHLKLSSQDDKDKKMPAKDSRAESQINLDNVNMMELLDSVGSDVLVEETQKRFQDAAIQSRQDLQEQLPHVAVSGVLVWSFYVEMCRLRVRMLQGRQQAKTEIEGSVEADRSLRDTIDLFLAQLMVLLRKIDPTVDLNKKGPRNSAHYGSVEDVANLIGKMFQSLPENLRHTQPSSNQSSSQLSSQDD